MAKLFILGAPDAEMTNIERVLKAHNEVAWYAEHVDGKRVHPGNAYKAGGNTLPHLLGDTTEVVLVECDFEKKEEVRNWYNEVKFITVDHHRPGDPGYGLPASAFWRASSIGQVYDLLGTNEIPHDDLVLAAMDSHPADAIRGLCPGVSAEEVLDRKIQEIATQTKLNTQAVKEAIVSFTETLHSSPVITIGAQNVYDLSHTVTGPDYATIAVAQTAVLADGSVALLKQKERDGEIKVTISGHAEPATVQAFMEKYAPAHGLERVYGVPSRGFAGGYTGEVYLSELGKTMFRVPSSDGHELYSDDRPQPDQESIISFIRDDRALNNARIDAQVEMLCGPLRFQDDVYHIETPTSHIQSTDLLDLLDHALGQKQQ